jgi:hypothetical protein
VEGHEEQAPKEPPWPHLEEAKVEGPSEEAPAQKAETPDWRRPDLRSCLVRETTQ